MSFVLFQLGKERPPKSSVRRILWGVVTLIPLGVMAGCLTVGAVLGWMGEQPMPESDLLTTTLWAAGFDLVFVLVLVLGTIRVREHQAQERSAAAGE